MTPVQIGLVSTLFFTSQMFWALLSGVLTDKLGRRLCPVIFDVLSWSVPAFLWMSARDYRWFVAAALFNGMWRVTENSWGLLLVEEAEPEKLLHLYAISCIAGLIAGFVAPIAYLFVRAFGVVSTKRVLYGITCLMMTAKFILLSHETAIGVRRRAEFKDVSVLSHLWDSRRVLSAMLKNRPVMLAVGLLAAYAVIRNVLDTFLPLLMTDRLGIAAENLSAFSTVKSLLMLVCYFTIVPRVSTALQTPAARQPRPALRLARGDVADAQGGLRPGSPVAAAGGDRAIDAQPFDLLNPDDRHRTGGAGAHAGALLRDDAAGDRAVRRDRRGALGDEPRAAPRAHAVHDAAGDGDGPVHRPGERSKGGGAVRRGCLQRVSCYNEYKKSTDYISGFFVRQFQVFFMALLTLMFWFLSKEYLIHYQDATGHRST